MDDERDEGVPGTSAAPECAAAPIRAGHIVRATLEAAATHAAAHGVDLAGPAREPRAPHEAVPAVGTRTVEVRRVTERDTAAAIGHPDEGVEVLSTPTVALWFELVSSALMPEPGGGLRHVGVGILVHHLDTADVGDDVAVTAEVASVDGRAVRFACHATCGGRLVAAGDHQRVVLDVG